MSLTRSIVWLNTKPVVSAGRACTPGMASSFSCRLMSSVVGGGVLGRCGRGGRRSSHRRGRCDPGQRGKPAATGVTPVGEEAFRRADGALPSTMDVMARQPGGLQALPGEQVQVHPPVARTGGPERPRRIRRAGEEGLADLGADLIVFRP